MGKKSDREIASSALPPRNDGRGVELVQVRIVRPIEPSVTHGTLLPGTVTSLWAAVAAEYVAAGLAIEWPAKPAGEIASSAHDVGTPRNDRKGED